MARRIGRIEPLHREDARPRGGACGNGHHSIEACLQLADERGRTLGDAGDVAHLLDDVEEAGERSEEHTSELQSQSNLVCRLLLEKKKNTIPPASSAR